MKYTYKHPVVRKLQDAATILPRLGLAFMVLTAAATPATAGAILFDNVPSAATSGGTVSVQQGVLGASFSTGPDSVVLGYVAMMLEATSPNDSGYFTLNLLSGTSTSLGTQLEDPGSVLDSHRDYAFDTVRQNGREFD